MFKKKLITSAITASLMMGIASTSFAATNPLVMCQLIVGHMMQLLHLLMMA